MLKRLFYLVVSLTILQAQTPKVTVTTRQALGAPLSFTQADKNFTDLRDAINTTNEVAALNVATYLSATKRTQIQDGTTIPDITTELQAAIDAAYIGQVVQVPNGNFRTTSTIRVGKQITIRGTGTYGTEGSYNLHSQWTIPNSGVALEVDPSYRGGTVTSYSMYSNGAWQTRVEGIKFQGEVGGGIAGMLTAAQIAINVHDGWELNIENCDFRNVGTCIALNGCWAVRASSNTFLDVGYAFREDPEFATAGNRNATGTDLYQANNIVIERNSIITCGYGIYLWGPFQNVSIFGNVIQGATQAGVLAATYNGSMSPTGTDLLSPATGLTIHDNYVESCAAGIQLGKISTGTISTSRVHGGLIEGNFFQFQGTQIYNLKVISADNCIYRNNAVTANVSTNDVYLDPNCYTKNCRFEAEVGWDGDLNTYTTSNIRRTDNSYRSWSSLYVDPNSGNKVTLAKVHTMGAGTSSKPFDSIATMNAWIQRVLRAETVDSPTSVASLMVTLSAATYGEILTFNNSVQDLNRVDVVMDGAAGADSVVLAGIDASNNIFLKIAGANKLVLSVDPSQVNVNQVHNGASVYLENAKLRYASAPVASAKGFFVYEGGRLNLSGVANYDATIPAYGLVAQGGIIFKNGTTPSGSTSNELISQGGSIRGDTTYDASNIQWQGTDYRMTNNNPVFYFGSGSGTTQFQYKGAAGTNRWFDLKTGSTSRASVGLASDAEAGSDAGSTFRIRLYNDAGSFAYDALTIPRTTATAITASGNWNFTGYMANSKGANVASATTITPTGQIFHVTGTTAVATINLPYTGFTGTITLIPDAAFTTTTAGNIGLASTAVIGKALHFTYDGTKWYPSY